MPCSALLTLKCKLLRGYYSFDLCCSHLSKQFTLHFADKVFAITKIVSAAAVSKKSWNLAFGGCGEDAVLNFYIDKPKITVFRPQPYSGRSANSMLNN